MKKSSPSNTQPALVLGLSPTGLIIIRSLGRKGIPVYGADFTSFGIGRFSKYCQYSHEIAQASRQRDGKVLCDALIEFAGKFDTKPVLYATNDSYIELLCPYYEELKDHFLFSTKLDGNAGSLLDKRSFYKLCDEHQVELPATFFPESHEDILKISKSIRYPAIIKPAYIHQVADRLKGKKVVQAFDAEQLIAGFEELSGSKSELIVQEVIPGPDSEIYVGACYFDGESKAKATFIGRKLRQYAPGFGSACLAESVWDQKVADLSLKFLEQVKFTGLCGTEFKRDPRDGRLKMIEINPRATLWMGLTRASGVDMPYIAYQDLLSNDVGHCDQKDGVKWIYLPRDIQSSIHYMFGRELSPGAWLKSMKGCKEEAILAWDDIAIGSFIGFYAARRLLRRFE